VWQSKFTGSATFQLDKVVRKVAFQDGAPTTTTSNLKNETLGPLLQNLKKISEADCLKLQAMSGYTQNPSPTLLAALGNLDTSEIQKLSHLADVERLKMLLSIKDGSVRLSNAPLPGAIGGAIIPVDNFLRAYLDGIGKFYDETRLSKSAPNITDASFIRYNRDAFYDVAEKFLIPEERGIATIASTAETVANIRSQSLLSPLEIKQNIFKLQLLHVVELESSAERDDRLLAEKLTPELRETKASIEAIILKITTGTSYFEILGVKADASVHEIENRYQQFLKKYPLNEITALYSTTTQEKPQQLHRLMTQLYETLKDPQKHHEYVAFLKSGKQGKFEEQSKSFTTDKAVQDGQRLMKAQQPLEAYGIFKQVLSLFPRDPRLLAWAGAALYQAGQASKAKELLIFAVKADPLCLDANLHYAETLIQEGSGDQAKPFLIRALELDSKNIKAKELLGKAKLEDNAGIEINAIFNNLNNLDYYALLDAPRTASRDELQRAYHIKTKQFHPDRFFTSSDLALRDKARALYKRCVEAYMVLKTPQKRKEYDGQLLQGSRHSTDMRLKDAVDVVQKKERSDLQVKNPQAKKFYTLALTSMQTGNFSGAILNLQLALKIEPTSELLQTKLKEAQEKSRA
jgi:curved DNA-binding protein CbpA